MASGYTPGPEMGFGATTHFEFAKNPPLPSDWYAAFGGRKLPKRNTMPPTNVETRAGTSPAKPKALRVFSFAPPMYPFKGASRGVFALLKLTNGIIALEASRGPSICKVDRRMFASYPCVVRTGCISPLAYSVVFSSAGRSSNVSHLLRPLSIKAWSSASKTFSFGIGTRNHTIIVREYTHGSRKGTDLPLFVDTVRRVGL